MQRCPWQGKVWQPWLAVAHLHVVSVLDVLLDKHAAVAKESLPLMLAGVKLLVHILWAMADEDAHATATACRLEQHRVSHLGAGGHMNKSVSS